MLRFRRNQVFLGVTPEALSHVRFSGVLSPSIVDQGTQPLLGKDAHTEAAAAFATLADNADWQGTEVHLTLADRLVRHFVFERPSGARSRQEIELAARLRFEDLFCTSSSEWEVRLALRPFATHLLACAVPSPMLSELHRHCARANMQLRSIRPYSYTEAGRVGELRRTAHWMLAVVGSNSIWLARGHGRNWQSVLNHPVGDSLPESLSRLLQQERLRMSGDGSPPIVWGAGALADPEVRRQLEEQSICLSGAPEWPGKGLEWTERYRIALSPVWPSCA